MRNGSSIVCTVALAQPGVAIHAGAHISVGPPVGNRTSGAELERCWRWVGNESTIWDSGIVSSGGAGLTSRLVPIEPCRLLDTRPDAPVEPGGQTTVPVLNRCNVPPEAIAVAVTVTSVGANREGWLAVRPAGSASGSISTLNVSRGATRANSTVVKIGDGGALTVEVDAGGHVLLDVSAAFVAAEMSRAGRYVPIEPKRLLDTRGDNWQGGARTLQMPLPDLVPADVIAVAVNVTIAGSANPLGGYITAHASGARRPGTSIQNTDGPGQVRAAAVIVPASGDGLEVYSEHGEPIVVDLLGYFTGPSAEESSDGLFVPVTPRRIVDTRLAASPLCHSETRAWPLSSIGAGSGQAAAIAATITMVSPVLGGWALAYAAQTVQPDTSSVNATGGQVAPNMVFAGLSEAGFAVQTQHSSHILVDVTGWFTGTPVSTSRGPYPQVRCVPCTTLVISDSTGAAMRWYTPALSRLTGTDFLTDLESCRRTIGISCRGRENRIPATTQVTVQNAPTGVETLVIMTGYNDGAASFARGIDVVVEEATRRGIERIAWLTMRTDITYSIPGGLVPAAVIYRQGNSALADAAGRYPQFDLMDWDRHSQDQDAWVYGDGIHLTPAGANALAEFISAELIRLYQ